MQFAGSATPKYGAQTPQYGSQTPQHGGARTPRSVVLLALPLHMNSFLPSAAAGVSFLLLLNPQVCRELTSFLLAHVGTEGRRRRLETQRLREATPPRLKVVVRGTRSFPTRPHQGRPTTRRGRGTRVPTRPGSGLTRAVRRATRRTLGMRTHQAVRRPPRMTLPRLTTTPRQLRLARTVRRQGRAVRHRQTLTATEGTMLARLVWTG
jgi:hypothetical protein